MRLDTCKIYLGSGPKYANYGPFPANFDVDLFIPALILLIFGNTNELT